MFQFVSDFNNAIDFAFSAGMIAGSVLTLVVILSIEFLNK